MTEQQRTSSERLLGLDHLRAIAIIMVFIFHYGRLFPHPEWTYNISRFGWTGVDLFFVLSGYLITNQLLQKLAHKQGISLKEFYIKRFFKILPPYLLVLLAYFLFPSFRERESLAPLIKYLTFTQNIGLDVSTNGTFSHAWSLCIEEQFYIFMPLILVALYHFKKLKMGYLLIVFLFIAGLLIRMYCWNVKVHSLTDDSTAVINWYKWIYYPTFCRLDGLLVGVSIAGIFCYYEKSKAKILLNGNLLTIAGVFVLICGYFLCVNQESFVASVFGFPCVSLGYGLGVTSAIVPSSLIFNISSSLTGTIARLSYSIYLVHKITIHLTQTYFYSNYIDKESNLMLIISIINTFILSFIINRIIEIPARKFRESIVK